MNENKYLVYAKIETAAGEDAVPTVTDMVMTSRPSVSFISETQTRNHPRSGFGEAYSAYVRKGIKFDFSVELAKDFNVAAPGEAPSIGKLLKACNFTEAITAGTGIVYTLGQTSSSLTIVAYHDGMLYKGVGCRGTWDLSADAGNKVEVKFSFTGELASTWKDNGAFPTFTVSLAEYLRFHNATTTINSWTGGYIKAFTFNLGGTIIARPDAGSKNGVREYYMNNAVPTMSIDPEVVSLSTFDPFAIQEGSALIGVSTEFLAADGSKCSLSATGMQLTETDGNSARDGIMNYAINLKGVNPGVTLTFENV